MRTSLKNLMGLQAKVVEAVEEVTEKADDQLKTLRKGGDPQVLICPHFHYAKLKFSIFIRGIDEADRTDEVSGTKYMADYGIEKGVTNSVEIILIIEDLLADAFVELDL